MSYTYSHPHFALTVDIILFTKTKECLEVLLIQRKQEPFKDHWAFPGGFVEIDELLDNAALRELEEETGVREAELQRLGVYDALGRDPRERTVSMAYFGLVDKSTLAVQAADDAAEIGWFAIDALPSLAFDHEQILKDGEKRIANLINL